METLSARTVQCSSEVLWGKIVFYEIYEDTEKVKGY